MNKEFITNRESLLAKFTAVAAIGTVALTGCKAEEMLPSQGSTSHEVVFGDTLVGVSRGALEACGTKFDGYDIQDGIRELIDYNGKNTNQLTAGGETIKIPDNFCALVLGE